MQTWCRGKKQFESEILCNDCHMFSWRSYSDPDFMLPEEYDKVRWERMVRDKASGRPSSPTARRGVSERVSTPVPREGAERGCRASETRCGLEGNRGDDVLARVSRLFATSLRA